MLRLVLLCSTASIALGASGGAWTYSGETGADHWWKDYSICKKRRQSPISIPLNNVQVKELPLLELGDGLSRSQDYHISNNGHTVTVKPTETTADVTLGGAGLPGDQYRMVNMHIHYGSVTNYGSEHTLLFDNRTTTFPAEIHIVFYNTKYEDVSKALPLHDGLAVLGFFIVEQALASSDLQFFKQDTLQLVQGYEHEGTVNLTLTDYIPKRRAGFFRYNGSLTTPPCHESVSWILLHDQLSVTPVEMSRLRAVPGKGTQTANGQIEIPFSMANNFRPTQPLHGRKVLSSRVVPSRFTVSQASATRAAVVLVTCFLIGVSV